MTEMSDEMCRNVWDIYQYSFPEFEKRKWETHCRAMGDMRFNPMGVIENEKIVGLIFYWKIDDISYIEHFAISNELRGKNYGTKILSDFCKNNDGVLLEIDPPIDDISKKREHFYHRIGFVTSEHSYIHNSYLKEDIPHTLLLMSYKKALTKTAFENYKNIMFGKIMEYSDKK